MKITQQIICVVFSLFWICDLTAQGKDSGSKTAVQFCSKNELGGLIGIGHVQNPADYKVRNAEWALEMVSINGIRYNPWFVGAGFGIRTWATDFTFPLFAHVSLDLWKSNFFLHADMGYQFGTRRVNMFGDKETGGFYAAYGLGYEWSVTEQLKLYVKTSVCHQNRKASGPYSGLGPSTSLEAYNPKYVFLRVSAGIRIH